MSQTADSTFARIARFLKEPDWILLIFLLLITNQAIITLKVAGILFIYICRFNVRFGLFKGRLPLFYPLICLLAFINLLVHVRDFSGHYLVAFGVAMGYWILCLLSVHQLKLSIERKGALAVHRTLQVFTILNLLASVVQLVHISLITHKLNPYTGLGFPYGMSTGDKIFGAFQELSYCNMMVSAMLCIYFLFRKDVLFGLISCTSLMMVFGNTGNIVFTATLGFIIVLAVFYRLLPASSRIKKVIANLIPPVRAWRVATGFALLFAVFYGIVSADNLKYTTENFAERFEEQTSGQKEETAEAEVRGNDQFRQLNFVHYERRPFVPDSADFRRREAITKAAVGILAGKRLSFRETKAYLLINPATFLLGAGPVRFSSLTAARMSGLDSSRLFKKILPRFSSPQFMENHRLISVYRVRGTDAMLSNGNWPDTFYNQLLGEYGILGLLLFAVFYGWFFLRRFSQLSYGFWIALMLVPFAMLSYLFEPVCVMLFFELLMFLDWAQYPERKAAGNA